jgi:hypothetical protein
VASSGEEARAQQDAHLATLPENYVLGLLGPPVWAQPGNFIELAADVVAVTRRSPLDLLALERDITARLNRMERWFAAHL